MTRRPGRPPAASREHVRDVARSLFAEHGYDAVSVGLIATRAGIGRSTLFSYFPAKADLMWEEFDVPLRHHAEVLSSSPRDEPARAVLERAVRALTQGTVEDRSGMRGRWAIVDGSRDLRAAVAARLEEQRVAVACFLKARIGTEPDGEVAAEVLSAALMAGVHAATRSWVDTSSTNASLTVWVGSAIEPILDGFEALLASSDRPGHTRASTTAAAPRTDSSAR